MSVRVALDDSDTGHEIIFFYRRGRPYTFLRDKKTKRFIRILRRVELRVFMEVEYSEEEAKKGNPLYVDAVGKTLLMPHHIPKLEEIENKVEDMVVWIVRRLFGLYVAHGLLDLRGIEYGSIKTVEEEWEEGKVHYVVIWKHHPEDKGKTMEGTLTR